MVSWPPARDRGQPGRDGGPSPRSTRCGSSLNMTSWMIRARGARCFAGKAFIPRISPNGARHAIREQPAAWRKSRPGGPGAMRRTRRMSGCGRRTRTHRRAGEDEGRPGGRGKSARALGTALRERGLRREAAAVIDTAFTELEPLTSVKRACELLGKSRATLHRQRNPKPIPEQERPPAPRAAHPAALSDDERNQVLAVLDSERFADKSPAQAWAPRPPTRPGSAPSSSPPARTRCGPGTSRN
jgi:hypothetical protein